MFLKKITYWGAGFACGIFIFVALFFVTNDYSFYTKGSIALTLISDPTSTIFILPAKLIGQKQNLPTPAMLK